MSSEAGRGTGRRFLWLDRGLEEALRRRLLDRASGQFEHLKLWSEAALCRAEQGDLQGAVVLYLQNGDPGAAAKLLLQGAFYAEALVQFKAWEERLAKTERLYRIEALLGQAACQLFLAGSSSPRSTARLEARAAFEKARELIAAADRDSDPAAARCWEALGELGVRLDRYDLVQEGFEKALTLLEAQASPEESRRVCRAYQAAAEARSDRLLARALAERLDGWPEESRPASVHDHEGDLDSLMRLKERIEHSTGAWIQEFGIDFSGEEPSQFRHYFMRTEDATGQSPLAHKGTIFTGIYWDHTSIPQWKFIHGRPGRLDTPWLFARSLAYLGPSLDPIFLRLSDLFAAMPEENQ